MTDDGVDHSHYHYDDFYQAVQSLICSFLEIKEGLNPLTRKSDRLLVSPQNITPESIIMVTRIKEMITNL